MANAINNNNFRGYTQLDNWMLKPQDQEIITYSANSPNVNWKIYINLLENDELKKAINMINNSIQLLSFISFWMWIFFIFHLVLFGWFRV